MRIFALIMLLALICIAVLLTGAVVLGRQPGNINIDSSTAFVYPEGDAFVLVLSTGAYYVEGTRVGGCYALTQGNGEGFGRATWVWPVCMG